MTDPTKAGFDVRYTPEGGQPRTTVFVPQETDDQWLRAEFEWTGADWRPVGTEPVTQVALFDEDCELTTPAREELLGADDRDHGEEGPDR
ncbi:hypothetical protein [Saliphagus sp. LR7]|uniref:hypothetical protein n=1 Tax=Saliphagus sp. LR7 TaxID=2282654 RepID=UPI000DF7D346|nr:hypothetical protein [Saliphagus sp. LR7]